MDFDLRLQELVKKASSTKKDTTHFKMLWFWSKHLREYLLQWRLSSQHHHRQRMNDPWAPFKSKSSWRKLLWMFCHDSCFFNKYYIFRGRGGGQGYTIIVAACNMWKLISHFSCLQKVFQFPGNCWWWVLKCRECVLKHSNKLVKFCCIFEVNFSSYF